MTQKLVTSETFDDPEVSLKSRNCVTSQTLENSKNLQNSPKLETSQNENLQIPRKNPSINDPKHRFQNF
jgi:hypothetical protein